MQEAFSNDADAENAYVIDVARFNSTDVLTINVMPETGATISATLSTDPDDTADDTVLTGTSFTLDISDVTLTSVLTLVITKANQTTTTYTFTIDASSRSTLSDIQNIITLAGVNLHADDMLGASMDFDNGHIVVGLPGYDATDSDGAMVTDSGAALVLSRNGTAWDATLLQPTALGASDAFGSTVAIQEDMLVISSPGEDGDADSTLATSNDNLMDSGSVHVYVHDASSMSWNASHYIKSSNPIAEGAFGALLDVWFTTNNSATAQIAIGSSGANAVEIFVRSVEAATSDSPANDAFQLLGSITGFDLDPSLLGNNPLALNENAILIGEPSRDYSIILDLETHQVIEMINAGAVKFFYRPNATATFPTLATRNFDNQIAAHTHYGYSVALQGNYIIVGEPDSNNGIVHVIDFTIDSYQLGDATQYYSIINSTHTVSASNGRSGDRFGSSVHLLNTALLVGAPGNAGDASTTIDTVISPDASDYVANSGAVYAFFGEDDPDDADDEFWELEAYLKPNDVEANDAFGSVVRIAEDGTIVGVSTKGVYAFQ